MDSFKPTDVSALPLDGSEAIAAVANLVRSKPFRSVNRKFVDPQKHGEHKFALFSFVKAPSAVADADGFFGVAKIRGSFFTEEEAAARAEELVRDVDSSNSIYTCCIGVPFPLVSKGFSSDLSEVNLQDKTEKAISENVRAKRLAEQKEMAEIRERREALMKDEGKIDSVHPEEQYVEQRVKLAHLRYAINEHKTKMAECIELEKKTRVSLNECRAANPLYEENYLSKYKAARRQVGISDEADVTGLMKYMADPIDPPGEDVSYIS